MSMKLLPFLLAISFALVGCDGGLKSPSDAFLIPNSELATVTNSANAGDLPAVKRLISHYEATTGNDAVTEKWREKARSLGDADELYSYAASLLIRAQREPGPTKKREMLVEALNSAKRSYSSRANASTQQLIDEIIRSLQGT